MSSICPLCKSDKAISNKIETCEKCTERIISKYIELIKYLRGLEPCAICDKPSNKLYPCFYCGKYKYCRDCLTNIHLCKGCHRLSYFVFNKDISEEQRIRLQEESKRI